MKKIFFYTFLLIPAALLAQVKIDRSKAPAPGPAPVIKVGQPATFTLANGLKVFVVQNTKLPRVSVTLTLDHDPVLEGNKAGMTAMAGSLMGRGTTTMKKAQLDEAIDFLGASISTDASSASVSSLTTNFSKAMALLSDVVLHPAFPASELEKIRKQTLSGLQTQKDDPNAITQKVISNLMYGKDHPYGDVETEETVKKITVDDIKKYSSIHSY